MTTPRAAEASAEGRCRRRTAEAGRGAPVLERLQVPRRRSNAGLRNMLKHAQDSARIFKFAQLGNGLCPLSRLAVCGLLRCVSCFSFSVLIISPAFTTFGLTVDDCFVVFVTDGLTPQGARVTKKTEASSFGARPAAPLPQWPRSARRRAARRSARSVSSESAGFARAKSRESLQGGGAALSKKIAEGAQGFSLR